ASPVFILCSATIANPGEFVERLVGERFRVIDQDGSPKGRKHFALWNPPAVGETMERRSASSDARNLMVRLMSDRIQTIAFTRAPVVAELLCRYTREDLQRRAAALANAVRAYRGGYLREQRREIERLLFDGEL